MSYSKTNKIVKMLTDSFEKGEPIKTYSDLQTISGCEGRTLQRRIKDCSLVASYNYNSKFYTLPKLAQFNRFGIWNYKGALFSRQGNFYNTLIHLVTQSIRGYTSVELSRIVLTKTDDALRTLWKQKRLHRDKHLGYYVYYSVVYQDFIAQKHNRLTDSAMPQPLCLPEDKNIIISVLVGIIHFDTLSAKVLITGLQKQGIKVSESGVSSIIAHYGLKKKKSK